MYIPDVNSTPPQYSPPTPPTLLDKREGRSRGFENPRVFDKHIAANPDDREWATDPVIRGYHKERLQDNIKSAHNAGQQKFIESMREYLSGKERAVDVFTSTSAGGFSWDRTSFTCGQFQFTISVNFDLHLKKGDKVFVQFHLADSVHPLKYTTNALPTDSASRLAISLSGRDATGEFHIWLVSSGPKAIKRMNTLVDILEGYMYPEREEMALPGRWWNALKTNKRTVRKQHYT